MFIVNESYSEGGSWRTATCPRNTAAGRRRLRQQIERRREKERVASKENERDRNKGSWRGCSCAGARSLLRFMRPLPSPLAQLSSRYNIVVYSEPRLRSVNHPSVLPPPPLPSSPPFVSIPAARRPRANPLIFLTRRDWRDALATTFSISAANAGSLTNRFPEGSPWTKFRFVCSGGAVFDWEIRVNSELFRRAVTCALMKPTFGGSNMRAWTTQLIVICDFVLD